MEAQLRTENGLVIKVEGDNQKELFEEIASAVEVFGEGSCGLCNSTKIKPVVREVEKNVFYEYVCQACNARLNLSVRNDKTNRLFPKRKLMPDGRPESLAKNEKGNYGPHRGWTKYRGNQPSA